MRMKTLLLIIDMQNDFCSAEGALYVPGAEGDVHRLLVFMEAFRERIDDIWLTQDNHQIMDIAHPAFWKDREGNPPVPFTTITDSEVREGKWIPRTEKKEVMVYLEQLKANGEYSHTIWPEHCIWGSVGAAIVPGVMAGVKEWAREGKYFRILSKGTHPLTEHFGAFRANISREDAPETVLNKVLIDELSTYDVIWVAGEAQSHCVATSVKQLLDFPEIVRKLVILEDCMSPVEGCENLASPIFEAAAAGGALFTTTVALISEP